MGLAQSVRNELLKHYFDLAACTPPANYYVALIKSDGNEVAGGSYARIETESADWEEESAGAAVIVNAEKLIFPQPTATWGTITQMKLFDADTAGTELGVADLAYSRNVTAVSPAPEIAAGLLRVIIT